MSLNLEVLTMPGINTKATGITTIATTEDGLRYFVPTYLVIVCDSETAITDGPTLSVGSNAATYDNFLATEDFTAALMDLHQVVAWKMVALPELAPVTDVKVNVTAVATGTAQTIRVDVMGYYI